MSEVIIPEKLQEIIEGFTQEEVIDELDFFIEALADHKQLKKPLKDGFELAFEDLVNDLKFRLEYIENLKKLFDEFLTEYKDSPDNLTKLLKTTKRKFITYLDEADQVD